MKEQITDTTLIHIRKLFGENSALCTLTSLATLRRDYSEAPSVRNLQEFLEMELRVESSLIGEDRQGEIAEIRARLVAAGYLHPLAAKSVVATVAPKEQVDKYTFARICCMFGTGTAMYECENVASLYKNYYESESETLADWLDIQLRVEDAFGTGTETIAGVRARLEEEGLIAPRPSKPTDDVADVLTIKPEDVVAGTEMGRIVNIDPNWPKGVCARCKCVGPLDDLCCVVPGGKTFHFVASEPVIVLRHCTNWNESKGVEVTIPVSELKNAIAIYGWTITTQLSRVAHPAAWEEYERLSDLPALDIPQGTKLETWRAKYVKRIVMQ